MGLSVLLAGATGLVGGECLKLLSADPAFDRIVVVTRRPLPPGHGPTAPPSHRPTIQVHVVDFDHLADHAALFQVDAILCALGTTIRAAGSRDAFRKVDYEYPVSLARQGLAQGVSHFLLVSALGADPHSRVFYNRVKGEVEAAISGMEFRSVSIFRPSLLLGHRREFRLGEVIAQRLAFLVPGKFKPIQAAAVARAMVAAARESRPGIHIVPSFEMRAR